MSNFLIFKAAFNNSATPAIGTYTVEGGTAQFNINTSLSPDYYMYAATAENPIKWFVPTAVVTDFEFVCDILTRTSEFGIAPYFTIADSNGVTRLRMESQYSNIRFMSDDTHGQSSSVICLTSPTDIGGYGKFHQFRIRIRKLTDSSSSVEVYANDNLVTSGTSPALITCGKISFLGATGAFVTGDTMGVKNAYVYDLSGGDVIDRGALSNAFTRFINWMKSKFALKSDIPTVNDGTLTIKVNGATAGTFTANQANAATANIQCVDLTSAQTVAGDKDFTGTTGTHDVIPATTDTYDLGSSAKEYNNAYIKSLTINGDLVGSGALSLKSKSGTSRIYLRNNNASAFPSSVNLYSKVGDNPEYGVYLNGQSFHPNITDAMNLGTANLKWKSLNGINPGALSLPSMSYISLDTTGFDVTATTIGTFTPTVDGWAILSMSQKNKPFGIWILQGSYRITFYSVYHDSTYIIFALIPVRAGITMTIYCTADDIDSTRKVDWLRLFPCQGNV